jgi:hypothetical protein
VINTTGETMKAILIALLLLTTGCSTSVQQARPDDVTLNRCTYISGEGFWATLSGGAESCVATQVKDDDEPGMSVTFDAVNNECICTVGKH